MTWLYLPHLRRESVIVIRADLVVAYSGFTHDDGSTATDVWAQGMTRPFEVAMPPEAVLSAIEEAMK